MNKTYIELKSNLKKTDRKLETVKIALLSDSSAHYLAVALKGHGYDQGLDFETMEMGFNQIEQQILDASSDLYQFKSAYAVIFKTRQNLSGLFYKLDKFSRKGFADQQLSKLESQIRLFNERLPGCRVLVVSILDESDAVFGNFSGKVDHSLDYQVKKINYGLFNIAKEYGNTFLIDINPICLSLGRDQYFNPSLYINGGFTFNFVFYAALARHITGIVKAIRGCVAKCIILDLDNTLWGGVIGDDGIEKIEIGGLGIGKAYSEFQSWLKQLKNRGIILIVCSKNDDAKAKEAFRKHPDMVLGLQDFALFICNWNNKVENIIRIQRALNIGFDSMVFIDDNPAERELIKTRIRGIIVPALPEDPADYVGCLQQLNLFETASHSEGDEDRTRQYQTEFKRSSVGTDYSNIDDFLASLQMTSNVKEFDGFSIPRIAQLEQRTNQFNLRTPRYSENNILEMAKSWQYQTFSFDLKDKFGDLGIVGSVILRKENKDMFIDSWVLSCRVFQRTVEEFMINAIFDYAKQNAFFKVCGEFIPTKKNSIVEDLFKRFGFKQNGRYWEGFTADFAKQKTFVERQESWMMF